MKGRFTVTQLLQILDEWTEALETGGRIDVIYTDFEKVFDKIPHKRCTVSCQDVPSYQRHCRQRQTQMGIDKFVNWNDKWQVKLNVDKC